MEFFVYSKARMNTRHPILLRITEYQFITIHLTNSGQVARYTILYIYMYIHIYIYTYIHIYIYVFTMFRFYQQIVV